MGRNTFRGFPFTNQPAKKGKQFLSADGKKHLPRIPFHKSTCEKRKTLPFSTWKKKRSASPASANRRRGLLALADERAAGHLAASAEGAHDGGLHRHIDVVPALREEKGRRIRDPPTLLPDVLGGPGLDHFPLRGTFCQVPSRLLGG